MVELLCKRRSIGQFEGSSNLKSTRERKDELEEGNLKYENKIPPYLVLRSLEFGF